MQRTTFTQIRLKPRIRRKGVLSERPLVFLCPKVYIYMRNTNDKVEVIRSARKTVALQIKADGSVIIRAPRKMRRADIEDFLDSRKGWIEKHRKQILAQRQATESVPKLSEEELHALADEAGRVIPERVRHYAPLVGVNYGRITIRNQRSRWGSCSSKGNLNFNCLLMLAPPEVLDSVVVHELCHRREMNHSERFYAEVVRVFPEYWQWNKWLKENGKLLMARMATE